jgi:HSP20 family protein
MTDIAVQKIDYEKPVVGPVLQELKEAFDAIRAKAFELFERRGGTPGQEVDDWIQAERELFWVPQAELAETDTEFKIQLAVPGFDAKDLQVTAQRGEILVRGSAEKRVENQKKNVCYSEFSKKSLYRRFELAAPIEVERTTARVEQGMLTVTAPKKTMALAKRVAA